MGVIMTKYEVPEKIMRMVKIFYEDLKCAVEDKRVLCEWFDIKTGVKQRCNVSGFSVLDYGLGQYQGLSKKSTKKLKYSIAMLVAMLVKRYI